jgi:hypothetical protein
MKKTKKIAFVLFLFAFLNMAFAPSARADEWGGSMLAANFQITREQMLQSIKETIIANLKMAAIRIIQARLSSLLGSVGGSTDGVAGMIISDWKAFIYTSASKYSTYATNSFFTNLNSGATSAMKQYVLDPAKSAVGVDYYNMRPDLQNYVSGGDPTKIFSSTSSSWPVGWRVAAMPQNDLGSIALRAEGVKQTAAEQQKLAKLAEGIAGQGNKSKEVTVPGPKDGQVTASNGKMVSVPAGSDYKGEQNISVAGSMLGYLKSEANAMPMRMLTLARSIPEVATAMVNQMIAQVIQQGAEKLATGSSSSSNLSSSLKSQMQSSIESGVRKAASPTMFFGN